MRRVTARVVKLTSGIAALAAIALASVCLVQEGRDAGLAPKGNWTVAEAKAFDAHTLWWLGEEYAGQSLTAVVKGSGAVTLERPGGLVLRDNSVTFLYGSCVVPGDGGCAAPYQVIVERNCDIRPDLIPPGDSSERAFRGAATLRQFPDGHYQIATGSVTITVFGPTITATRQMADDLVSVNLPTAIEAGARLSGPTSDCGPAPFAAAP